MIYTRKLKKELMRNMNSDLILVVTGMRRVGKTYLLQDIFNGLKTANKIFFDLERDKDLSLFKENNFTGIERNFKQRGINLISKQPGDLINTAQRAWIFIDEIQYYRKLTSILKYFADHFQVKFVVTGSSSFYLKNYFSESLAGRKKVFNLYPLDFSEYLQFQGKENLECKKSLSELMNLHTHYINDEYVEDFNQYLRIGGFPQVVLAKSEQDQKEILQDILTSYLAIDVQTLADIKKIDDFRKLIYLLPARVGQKMDISKLSRITGLARETVANYLALLQNTFVISLIKPFSRSPDREISSVPKLYFSDHGLAGELGELSEGQRLENYVYSQLKNHFKLNYFQRKSGAEIDFIADKKIGIEVKIFGDSNNLSKLERLSISLKLPEYYLVTKKAEPHLVNPIIPAYLLGFLDRYPLGV